MNLYVINYILYIPISMFIVFVNLCKCDCMWFCVCVCTCTSIIIVCELKTCVWIRTVCDFRIGSAANTYY
jgi:hypothetical protein